MTMYKLHRFKEAGNLYKVALDLSALGWQAPYEFRV